MAFLELKDTLIDQFFNNTFLQIIEVNINKEV